MKPVVDRNAAQELNLAVLKRIDPDVDEVLATAGHVCLYHMSVDTKQWHRKNVEGSLYLLKRRTNPRFQMMVLNKLATDNYMETIHGGLDFEVTPPYLMYTHGNSEIHGIWFYERDDLDRIAALLNRIRAGLPRPDILPNATKPDVAPTAGSAAAKGDDGGFWDKSLDANAKKAQLLQQGDQRHQHQVHHVQPIPTAQPTGHVGPTPPASASTAAAAEASANAISNLFKQAHLKQAAAAPAAPPAPPAAPAGPPAAEPAAAIAPLPPSYFRGGAPMPGSVPAPAHKSLAELRKPPALSPAASLDLPSPRPPVTTPSDPNALQKLFAKAGAAAPSVSQQPPAADVSQQRDSRQQQGSSYAQGSLQSRLSPNSEAGKVQIREKLRTALNRLLTNDAFVDMLAEEFMSAGLMH